MSTISKSIKLYPEVSEALSNNRPLVAFESTILTHGLPYPDNLNLSKSLTQICEENGVVGATIAIHQGNIKVGLSPEEIDDICSSSTPNNPKPSPIKGTTRQLGYLLHQTKQMDNLWGGTTVASTSYIASKIGIKVFVTGGAGGVHRRLSPSDPLDVSADLVQLANNPNPLVTVSSGVKSILDVPNTLETLETLGVTVGAYKSEYFPMFYSDFDESIKSPIVFGSPEEVAQTLLMNASIDYGGVLCAVPKPELLDKIEAGMTPRQLIENSPADKTLPIIAEALKAAKEQNIIGKDVTPFVLEKVKVLTGGETVAVNVGLVQNNLRVGIEIAKALHSGHDSDHKDDLAAKLASDIIVMGGAVIDSVSNAQSATSSILPNTSSIGTTRETHGGVGRNISEAIGKVLRSSKRKIAFHTVLGGDQTSENINAAITENLKEAGVEQVVANVLCGARTARYTAILQNSDLAYAVADMELFSKDANWRLPTDPELERARALVVDCNLPPTTLSAAINRFRQTEGGKNDKKVVVVDPTSVEKAVNCLDVLKSSNITYILPSETELYAMAEVDNNCRNFFDRQRIVSAARAFLQNVDLSHETKIIVTCGPNGVIICSRTEDNHFEGTGNITDENLVSTSGAGDTFCGVFVASILEGLGEDQAILRAIEMAERTCMSARSVGDF